MDYMRNGRPRVVVTGIGVISPLGSTLEKYWHGLRNGISGIKRISKFDPSHLQVQIAGEVTDFNPIDFLEPKEARRLEPSSQFAVGATKMAIADAGFTEEDLERQSERSGVVMGTGFGGFDSAFASFSTFRTKGSRPGPMALTASLTNMPAHYVSMTARAKGPLSAVTTACAAGTQAIGEAMELIRRGRADIVYGGGVEGIMQDYTIAAFDSMTVLARDYNNNPTEASRPFDKDRNGFVYAEGCGVLVLESLEHAKKRGARVYAEILGHGSSSDAYHVAAIEPEAAGALRSMRWAMEDAGLNPEDIDYINPHGTSTPPNDALETLAIKRLLGERAYEIAVSSTKSMIGHAFGGAGALEAVATILMIFNNIIHPTINYRTPDPDCDLDYVPNEARDAKIRYALSNNLGLGGQNATVAIGAI
jgi:3-oxoacyl-[acyl-carrier-protein] synthase II